MPSEISKKALSRSPVEYGDSEMVASKLEKVLSSQMTPFVITLCFVVVLIIWSLYDHSLPVHDAAWHSTYSSSVKQWLERPRTWNLQSYVALLSMQPNYPAGSWFFNGLCKIILGDNLFSEHMILAVHLCILSLSTYLLSNLLWKDRLKANLSLLILNCCPLILALEHISFIDLPHTAFFAAFLTSAVWWWQKHDWKRALICAALFALDCISKQIAVLYSVPLLFVFAALLVYRKQFAGLLQLAAIGMSGALLLCTWVVPNLNSLLFYTHNRSSLEAERVGFFVGMFRNLKMGGPEIFEAVSPLMAFLLVFSCRKIPKSDLQTAWPALFAPLIGAALVLCAAFFNLPETRYFGPLMIPFSLFLGSALTNMLRQSKNARIAVVTALAACVIQALVLCFQQTPVVFAGGVPDKRPAFVFFGVTDPQLTQRLSYVPNGDPWKQRWLFDFIENAEHRKRPVYLNVLDNSPEFNQGTLLSVSRMRHSCVFPTTWHCTMGDISDSFNYSDEELRAMQWLLLAGGNRSCRWYDQRSKDNYEIVLTKLRNSTQFVEAARELLPDGSDMVLYRNKRWFVTDAASK
jgi:hypothetical protein